MKKSKIYTKTGDTGETGLVSGNRISKADLRIDLYGELDELNSRIGLACSHLSQDKDFKEIVNFLHNVQSAIFDLGFNLACEVENRAKFNLPQIQKEFVAELETEIDKLDNELETLKNFILPGGAVSASQLQLCRTNTRTCERKMISYHNTTSEELPQNSLVFLNRLSDYFFVLSRYVNKAKKADEISWRPRN